MVIALSFLPMLPSGGPWQVRKVEGVVIGIVCVGPLPSHHARHLTVHADRLRLVRNNVSTPPSIPSTCPPPIRAPFSCRPPVIVVRSPTPSASRSVSPVSPRRSRW